MTSIKKLHTTLSIFFLWIVISLPAQEYSISKKYLTVEDGLSSSQVHDIYKDAKGFMWFLTSAGADRYDGVDFKFFEGNAKVKQLGGYNKIHEDVHGNIWLAFRGYRLYYNVYSSYYSLISIFNSKTNQIEPFENKFPDCPFTITDITFIHQDENRKLWFGLKNGQAWTYDGQFKKIYDNNKQFSNSYDSSNAF